MRDISFGVEMAIRLLQMYTSYLKKLSSAAGADLERKEKVEFFAKGTEE